MIIMDFWMVNCTPGHAIMYRISWEYHLHATQYFPISSDDGTWAEWFIGSRIDLSDLSMICFLGYTTSKNKVIRLKRYRISLVVGKDILVLDIPKIFGKSLTRKIFGRRVRD